MRERRHFHFPVFTALLTWILIVEWAHLQAGRTFTRTAFLPRLPVWNDPAAGWLALCRGAGLHRGATPSICRATDTISAYMNHISTAGPPGACGVDSFMAHFQNATCQSAEWQIPESRYSTLSHGRLELWGFLSNGWKLQWFNRSPAWNRNPLHQKDERTSLTWLLCVDRYSVIAVIGDFFCLFIDYSHSVYCR